MSGRLKRSDCSAAGIHRVRRGRGFAYVDASGERIDDDQALERIASLAIPPAWKDVWICLDPMGHIQATGYDEAGRKQYLYHDRWHARAAARKFDSMREFARKLPKLRRAASRDLRREGIPRERALACAVKLLDLGFFRVGGERYAEENESYGLATIRREHLTIADGEAVFDFPAKSNQRRVQSVRDAKVIAALEAMRRRRGGPEDLLVYKEGRRWRDVRSEDVNEYIQTLVGEEHSAKDFRTWHGTVLAAIELAVEGRAETKGGAERRIRAAIKRVAEHLGNTPAVARSAYIDPRLLDCFRDGATIELPTAAELPLGPRARTRVERQVLEMLY